LLCLVLMDGVAGSGVYL